MPLHKHGLPNETLIEHFLARKEKYTEIITWLRRNKPSLRRIEIQQAEEQDTNTLFSFLCAAPTNLATVKPVCAQALQTADNALRQTSTTNQRLTTIPKARGVLTHGNPDDLYKTSIINQMTLNIFSLAESPYQRTNQQLAPFINTDMLIDNLVLDIFIHKAFATQLMEQRIIVLPTIRHNEAISLDQIKNIKAGEKIPYPYQIAIKEQNNDIETTEIREIEPIKNPRYLLWPVNNEHKEHYGLFILDLAETTTGNFPRAYYIEPLRLENILRSKEPNISASLPRPIDYDQLMKNKAYREELTTNLSPILYQSYLQELTPNLSIERNNFRYIHLAQEPGVNYCSDYIIAIVAQLAAKKLDIVSNGDSLLSLETNYLNIETVQTIRLLEIQRFNTDYYKYQIPSHLKKEIQNSPTPVNQKRTPDKRKADKKLDEALLNDVKHTNTRYNSLPKRSKIQKTSTEKIAVEVNLVEFPEIDTLHLVQGPAHLTVGDLHGNALKLLFILQRHGVITNLTQEMYTCFLMYYIQSVSQCITSEDLSEIRKLIDAIEVNSQATITLLGDILADRGGNDYLTLLILEKLHQSKITLHILLSNHDSDFIESYESPSRYDGVLKNITSGASESFNVYQISELQDYSPSMLNMGALIEEGVINIQTIDNLILKHYLPLLKLLFYTINDDETAITLYSHAPIGLTNILYLAMFFKIPYNDETVMALTATIDKLNDEFQKSYVQKEKIYTLIREKDAEVNSINMLTDPVNHLIWNRNCINLYRPPQHKGYHTHFVHGHHFYESQAAHIINLDNNLGKRHNEYQENYRGEYTALYSTERACLQKKQVPLPVGKSALSASPGGFFQERRTNPPLSTEDDQKVDREETKPSSFDTP